MNKRHREFERVVRRVRRLHRSRRRRSQSPKGRWRSSTPIPNIDALDAYFIAADNERRRRVRARASRRVNSWKTRIVELDKFVQQWIRKWIIFLSFVLILRKMVTQERITASLDTVRKLIKYVTSINFADLFPIDADLSSLFAYQEVGDDEIYL